MEVVMAAAVGLLFFCGTYMILRPNLIRVAIGFALYSNGANLAMIVCGGYPKSPEAPFMDASGELASKMDPLPPDIVLTAIVISFAVAALLLTLCYRVYCDAGTDDPEMLKPDGSPARGGA